MDSQLCIKFDFTKKEMIKILKTEKSNLAIHKMNIDFHLQILRNEIKNSKKGRSNEL